GNYPDEMGPTGSFTWGGVAFDHYPDFDLDKLGGVVNQPELAKRILDEGHEISSHTYAHRLFGQNRIIYGKRKYFTGLSEVIDDLKQLDTLMREQYSYGISLARPPHYIDKTCDGHDAYDAYRYMNYQYMAASFDGGGWQVSGDYSRDVAAMVSPMEKALSENAAALDGSIIFQKDGCNMSRETPVADALSKQLDLLIKNGYKVIPVSELLSLSPFEDTDASDPVHESARRLVAAGYCVAYKNNTLQPDRAVTLGEFAMMCAEPAALLSAWRSYVDAGFVANADDIARVRAYRIKPTHPYFHALVQCVTRGIIDASNADSASIDSSISPQLFTRLMTRLSGKPVEYTILNTSQKLMRRDVLPLLADTLL
ncbi:MAG: hypothetical protein RR994_04660, partial [Clostridia bacterium]